MSVAKRSHDNSLLVGKEVAVSLPRSQQISLAICDLFPPSQEGGCKSVLTASLYQALLCEGLYADQLI